MSSSQSNARKDDLEKGITEHHEHAPVEPIQLTRDLEPGGTAPAVGDFSQRFGNPTPLAIVSFCLVLLPTSCCLMGWGSADVTSLASLIGPFYFSGGLAMVVSGVMEWIIGNTFPFVVFVTFGGFWLSLGVLNDPMHTVISAYNGTGGASSPAYNSGLVFYFAFWGVLVFIYLIASLRTNVVFAFIFFTLVFTFALLSAGYGRLAVSDVDMAVKLLKGAGGFAFATSCAGFYLSLVLMIGCVNMPFKLPLGDLSGLLSDKKSKTG